MAFVSQLGKSVKRGAKSLSPFVRFRKTMGGGGGFFNVGVAFRGEKIDIEIDEEEKRIRFCRRENGVSVSKNGSFSCSASILDIVGAERIFLTLEDDGYWYGSYA